MDAVGASVTPATGGLTLQRVNDVRKLIARAQKEGSARGAVQPR